jgi:hypothetical protein
MEDLSNVPETTLAQKVAINIRQAAPCPMKNTIMASMASVQRFCELRRTKTGMNDACIECAEYGKIQQGIIPEWIRIKEIDKEIDMASGRIAKCIVCGEVKPTKVKGMCNACSLKEYRKKKKMIIDETISELRTLRTKTQYSTNPAFDSLLRRMGAIHDAKRQDYAGNDNPLGNFDAAQMLGISPMMGIMVRMTDKFTRACNLAKRGHQHVKDESLEDTLLDLANYAVLAILSREREQG